MADVITAGHAAVPAPTDRGVAREYLLGVSTAKRNAGLRIRSSFTGTGPAFAVKDAWLRKRASCEGEARGKPV